MCLYNGFRDDVVEIILMMVNVEDLLKTLNRNLKTIQNNKEQPY